jgi:hypothetical protein
MFAASVMVARFASTFVGDADANEAARRRRDDVSFMIDEYAVWYCYSFTLLGLLDRAADTSCIPCRHLIDTKLPRLQTIWRFALLCFEHFI